MVVVIGGISADHCHVWPVRVARCSLESDYSSREVFQVKNPELFDSLGRAKGKETRVGDRTYPVVVSQVSRYALQILCPGAVFEVVVKVVRGQIGGWLVAA